METNNTACNALLVAPRCGLAIVRGQTFGRPVRIKCLLANAAPKVVAKVELPADSDGNLYVVTVDGEKNGGWINTRKAAKAHADKDGNPCEYCVARIAELEQAAQIEEGE